MISSIVAATLYALKTDVPLPSQVESLCTLSITGKIWWRISFMISSSRLHVVCNEIDVDSPWTFSKTGYRRPSGSALILGYVFPKRVFKSRASSLSVSDVAM